MRRALRQPLAVAFALLVVTAAALGAAFVANDDVRTLEGASDEYVQRGAAFSPSDGLIIGYASGAIETYQSFVDGNEPTDELAAADWSEAHTNIYQAHVTQQGNADAQLSIMENYLNDTRSIALMTGKKAYVAALERDATKGEAEISAYEAVEGYYKTKQRNLLSAWNMTAQTFKNGESTYRNYEDTAPAVYELWYTQSNSYGVWSTGNASATLVDGSTVDVLTMQIEGSDDIYPAKRMNIERTIMFAPPSDSNLSPVEYVDTKRWSDTWDEIESQNQKTQNQLTTFINATYDSYQAGDLNESDFVDPYMGSRSYSPETSDTFTLRSLSAMGLNTPENLSNIGRMTVTHGGTNYTGVLMSEGTPPGGFVVGETYNTSQLAGPQWVALDSGDAHQLEGTFTLAAATRADGADYEANESVAYRNVTYETADMTELQELNEKLNDLKAQINARQQRLRNSGGVGWLPDLGGLTLGSVAPVVLIAGGALVLLGRN